MLKAIYFLISALVLISAQGQWKKADLTNFQSYDDCCDENGQATEDCNFGSGCKYAGIFAFISGRQTKSWVQKNNIIGIHEKYEKQYKLKTLEIRSGSKTIKAKVYDKCSDTDCNGCCTKNQKKSGFMIDMEINTVKRFGKSDGVVEWRCLDC